MENRRAPKRKSVPSAPDSALTTKKGKPVGQSSTVNQDPSTIAPFPERNVELTGRAPEGNLHSEVPPASSPVKEIPSTTSSRYIEGTSTVPIKSASATATAASSTKEPIVAKTEKVTGRAPGGNLHSEVPPESSPVKTSSNFSNDDQDFVMHSVKSTEASIKSSASTVEINSEEHEVLDFNPELRQVWRSPASSASQANATSSSPNAISASSPSEHPAGARRSLSAGLLNEFDDMMGPASEEYDNVNESPTQEETAAKNGPPKKKPQQ